MVVQLTLSDTILEQMAEEQRVVLSPWRAAVYIRRATYALPEERRRWHQFPTSSSNVLEALSQMRGRNTLQAIPNHPGYSRVSTPFTRNLSINEHELLFELHPYAALSHLSALQYHGLSIERETYLTMSVPSDGRGDLLPLGTRGLDWEGAELPSGSIPKTVLNTRVLTKRVNPADYFGLIEVEPRAIPLRYTGLERTLIDAIQSPRLCGGVEAALSAWFEGSERIDVNAIVRQVERLNIAILRQRIGFLLEELGLTHSHLTHWQQQSQRGGSSRLVASLPFSSTYNERWNLSLNAPLGALYNT